MQQLSSHFDELMDRAEAAGDLGAHRRSKILTFRAQGVLDALRIVEQWNMSKFASKK